LERTSIFQNENKKIEKQNHKMKIENKIGKIKTGVIEN